MRIGEGRGGERYGEERGIERRVEMGAVNGPTQHASFYHNIQCTSLHRSSSSMSYACCVGRFLTLLYSTVWHASCALLRNTTLTPTPTREHYHSLTSYPTPLSEWGRTNTRKRTHCKQIILHVEFMSLLTMLHSLFLMWCYVIWWDDGECRSA